MRPRKRRIRVIMALGHSLRPALYQRPKDDADKSSADDPATDAARDGPEYSLSLPEISSGVWS